MVAQAAVSSREPVMSDEPTPAREGDERGLSRAQKQLIGFIVVLAAVNVAYRLVYASGAAHTAALYVGVPTLLAIGLALLPRSRSATGMLLKGSTLALLIACVILPEGLLCLLFVVPLVGLVAVIVGGAIDWTRHRKRREGPTLMVVSLPLLLLSMEGLAGTPFDSHDTATASITIHATSANVEAALAATPSFETHLPPFLRVGFNRPVAATGAGLDIGDERMIEFTGGTHHDHPLRLFGLTGERSVNHHSHMHLTVIRSEPCRLVFRVDQDTTMLARWANLERAVVTWERTDEATTRVSWRLEYERLIYPTAYFAPLQRFGMAQAAGYLLDAVVKEQLP
jgi:hypothetical protein